MTAPDPLFYLCADVPLLLLAAVYLRGLAARAQAGRPVPRWRAGLFLGGCGLLLASLEWPFARLAHQLFYLHELGLLSARIVGPMLIALAHPAGTLIAGLPRAARRRVLGPALSSTASRKGWSILAHPASVVTLYLGLFVIWQLPGMQAAAIDRPAAGLSMHLSLFLSGLLFWTRIFERRPAPHAPSHGERLMMAWLAMLAQIAVGAVVTLRTTVLYTAYAAGERALDVSPIVDQQRGGVLIWVPGALLTAAALITVVDMLGRHETRMDIKRRRWTPSNSAILLYPTTAEALRVMVRGKNRKLAIGMGVFAVAMFVLVQAATVSEHRQDRDANIKLFQQSRSWPE